MSNGIVSYKADSGNEVKLSLNTVRNYLCNNPNVTTQEFLAFAALCKAHRLDPFIREAYIIKYGNNPATVCVGKDTYTKRAFRNPRFRGMSAGVCVLNRDGALEDRKGSLLLEGEELVGAWAAVNVAGYEEPIYDSVSFNEYAGRKKDGTLNSQWQKMPGTMIRKVAIVHALREAFPEDLAGMYDQSEMSIEEPEPVSVAPVAVEDAAPWGEPVEAPVYEESF